jgi:Fe-S protein assembly chaperone HscA
MAEDKVVGIDLGTTNSLVAYMASGPSLAHPDEPGKGVYILPGEDGSNLVPSVVALDENKHVLVGNAARAVLLTRPERAVYSVKRLMGRGVEDVQDELKLFPFRLAEDLAPGEVLRIQLGERTYTPPEVSAQILRQLKRNAERFFGSTVKQAVITVPAYFNDAQRQATKDAGRIAGLEVLRLVNEPTAASLAYGLDKKQNGTIAVYDFGGGTFDVSILKLKDGIFEVIATNGDTHLGGDDIDNLMITVAVEDIAGDLKIDIRKYPEAVQKLRAAVIEAKIALSSQEAASIDIELPSDAAGYAAETAAPAAGARYQRKITREMFEQMVQPIVERTLGPCRQALKDAELTADQVDEVVLVGGSTRIPLVRRRVEELFGRKPHTELNPDEVVALGAAVQANILAGGSDETKDMLLLDVTPLSLGIEALGGVTAKIIHRNSTIPASATEHFTTGVEGQVSVAIHVLQGEREMAKDCRSLARFDLKGIPPMPAGLPRIEVRFLIDANGILHVSAREQRSGKEAEIQVQPSYGLTDEQVENMILDSFDNAEQDLAERQLVESRREAETILTALQKGRRNEAWKLLSMTEQMKIDELEQALRVAVSGTDYNYIRRAIDELNQATMHLAELMMDSAVGSALRGKNMESTDLDEGPAAPHPIGKAEFN